MLQVLPWRTFFSGVQLWRVVLTSPLPPSFLTFSSLFQQGFCALSTSSCLIIFTANASSCPLSFKHELVPQSSAFVMPTDESNPAPRRSPDLTSASEQISVILRMPSLQPLLLKVVNVAATCQTFWRTESPSRENGSPRRVLFAPKWLPSCWSLLVRPPELPPILSCKTTSVRDAPLLLARTFLVM